MASVVRFRTYSADSADARTLADLARFSCGEGIIRSEREVDEIVAAYCNGDRPALALRITRDAETGTIAGIAGIECGHLDFEHPLIPRDEEPAYLSVIGISKTYRHRGLRLGDRLLADALRHVRRICGARMPLVLAAVDPENTASCRLFERHGFSPCLELRDQDGDAQCGEFDVLYSRDARAPLGRAQSSN